MMSMDANVGNLTLIKNNLTYKQRMDARIEAFRHEILSGEGDLEYIEEIMRAIHDYLLEFSDEDVIMGSIRLKESIFYIDHYMTT